MIESIEFKNFKALRDAKLPLSQFTLIVGPNGSGKSTALNSIPVFTSAHRWNWQALQTAGVSLDAPVSIAIKWAEKDNGYTITTTWDQTASPNPVFQPDSQNRTKNTQLPWAAFHGAQIFSLDPRVIAQPVPLRPQMELDPSGLGLAGVLDQLRDVSPEYFEALNEQLGHWIPEFDRILFETPSQGLRSIALRTREGPHSIRAVDLSQGTLIALALLTIAYLPEPPSIVCLEEPDHGLHPRLLRDVRDALYRLAYPEGAQEKREPVQVIATTHNPYFLDLFREHPEEIVIAEKVGLDARFSRLSDRADLEEILGDAPLSEVWYSGVLGGVPAGT